MRQKLKVSVGIFAHNEEANIKRAVESVMKAKFTEVQVDKIVVISSGSLDNTNKITRLLAKKHKRILLVTQSQREGKASAVNLFLSKTKSPILITMSADLEVDPKAIEEICLPFLDQKVGMVGAHPKPRPIAGGQINREIKLLWQLHHEISLIRPKCGEMVAFRNIIRQIPTDSAVDEANIEVLLTLLGYTVTYAPRAIVYNRGPKNTAEFLRQRRRVQAGHHWVLKKYNYKVSTLEPNRLIEVVVRHLFLKPRDFWPMMKLVGLELSARFLGYIDFHLLGRNPYNWKMVSRR